MNMEAQCEPMDTIISGASVVQNETKMFSEMQKPFAEYDLENLYASLGISGNNNQVRYEVIHLRCSKELYIQDVIPYFSQYNPKYIETVDEESFNIVWLDKFSAAKALFSISQTVDGIPVRATTGHMIDNMRVPSGNWILGKGHINLSSVLLRFSMSTDKRPRTKEACSQYLRNNNNTTVYSGPVNKKNPWGNLSQSWDESYELSNRKQNYHPDGDARGRVQLKARRRIHK